MEYDESSKSLGDYVNLFRRRKRLVGIVAAAVFAVIALITVFWPATYRSESIILIEQQDIPAELVQTTITSYAQQRIEEIRARIMTIGNIMDIVDEFELYDERELQRKTRTEIAEEFKEAVSIRPISAEVVDPRSGRPSSAVIAFSLAFDGGVPAKVQKVTSQITDLYLEENLKERTQQTKSTSDFLTAEAESLSRQLSELDAQIANFKEQNKGALPELNQFNLSVVDRTESTLNDLEFQLKELEKRKIDVETELIRLNPTAPVVLATGQTVLGDADRLKALQTQLRAAQATYRDDHPTVARLKREVDALLGAQVVTPEGKDTLKQLATERNKLAALQEKYTNEHPEIARSQKVIASLEKELQLAVANDSGEEADNPAYLVVQSRLAATNEDIRATEKKISESRIKLEKYEGYLSQAPQVEKEFQRLQRDYQNTYMKYQEIRSKQMSADLASNLESERKGERFTLIQPPELPIQPVSPNRVALILLGLILAGGAGIGAALLMEALDDALYGEADVLQVTGAAPLVMVGYMEDQGERSAHQRKRYMLVGIAVAAVVLVLMLFHFFIKPLDVTWYILLRKLGIN